MLVDATGEKPNERLLLKIGKKSAEVPWKYYSNARQWEPAPKLRASHPRDAQSVRSSVVNQSLRIVEDRAKAGTTWGVAALVCAG